MDLKTESCVKLLLLILVLVIIIQFILILYLCSCHYMDYLNRETHYDSGWEPDTLRIISSPASRKDSVFSYDDFYFGF